MFKTISYLVSGSALLFAVAIGNVHGGSTDISLGALNQTSFNDFIDEFGVAIAYNPISPAEPLGLLGFDVGVAVSTVQINTTIWDKVVANGSAPSTLILPRLMVRKGLPMGFDVGFSSVSIPGSNVSVIGFELRKAILDGTLATPAVSVLVHSSKLSGVDDFDVSTYGVDVGISKGFIMLTPYAGVGQVWVSGAAASGTFSSRDSTATRSYVGIKIGFLPFMNVVVQADFAEASSYSVRLNFGF